MNILFKSALVLAGLGLVLFMFWTDIEQLRQNGVVVLGKEEKNNNLGSNKEGKKKKKGDKEKDSASKGDGNEIGSAEVKILKKWTLPPELTEVSGIIYMDNNLFACVQDEEGKIFIFNSETGKIEKQIPFASIGDYEGLAVVDQSAYVVRSDGRLYEITGFMEAKPSVKEYDNHLTADHDVEGLGYDKKNNRLLLAIKGKEHQKNVAQKGIYAFDLVSKKLATDPAYKLNMNDAIFKDVNEKKADKIMQPSEIQVHPVTNDIYILEGADPKLLVLGTDGNNKRLYKLNRADFPQAEGLTFNQEGEMYISNEGKNKNGTILKVEITDL